MEQRLTDLSNAMDAVKTTIKNFKREINDPKTKEDRKLTLEKELKKLDKKKSDLHNEIARNRNYNVFIGDVIPSASASAPTSVQPPLVYPQGEYDRQRIRNIIRNLDDDELNGNGKKKIGSGFEKEPSSPLLGNGNNTLSFSHIIDKMQKKGKGKKNDMNMFFQEMKKIRDKKSKK
jgi:hypothetical protein